MVRFVPFEGLSLYGDRSPRGWHDTWSNTRVVHIRGAEIQGAASSRPAAPGEQGDSAARAARRRSRRRGLVARRSLASCCSWPPAEPPRTLYRFCIGSVQVSRRWAAPGSAEQRIRWAAEVTIQDLGSVGELIAAVATLGTLIYLARQIRQNTRTARVQSAIAIVTQTTQANSLISQSPEINRVFWNGLENPDGLDRDERRYFESILSAWLSNFETTFLLNREGASPEGYWESQVASIDWLSTERGFLQYWEKWRLQYPDRWRAFVDSRIQNSRAVASQPGATPQQSAAADSA